MSYTKEDLAGLTPDEAEALLAEQQPEVDTMAEIASETPTETQVETPAAETEPVAAETPAAESAPENAEAKPEAEAGEETPPVRDFIPEFKSTLKDGHSESVADLTAKANELNEKLRNGEIDIVDYVSQKDVIDAELFELRLSADRAKWASEQNEQITAQRWKWEVDRFLSQKSSEMYSDKIAFAALNAAINEIATNPDNQNRSQAWLLEEADRQVRSRFGVASAPVALVPKPEPAAPITGPKTISAIPAAAPAPVGDDLMSKIGMLEGEELERYVARLSPADVDKLVRAA